MKEIELTQNQISLVNNSDYEYLSQWKWHAHYDYKNKCFYACRINVGQTISMAREIMNCPDNMVVDHRDHNTLNNQRFNLRTCTHQENCRNQKPPKNNTSKYKGIHWHKINKKWVARIGTENIFGQSIRLYLGSFSSKEEAAEAYDEAARYHFGEFAYLNFPDLESR